MESFLEVGKILNTHGVRGELKAESWCNTQEDLCNLEQVYVNGTSYRIVHARIHGSFVLLTLEGIGSIDDALPLKGRIMTAPREALQIEEGQHFVADLIGLDAKNEQTGEVFGTITDILEYPAQDIYVIEGEKRYLIPDVPEFVCGIDEQEGAISFRLLEGMGE